MSKFDKIMNHFERIMSRFWVLFALLLIANALRVDANNWSSRVWLGVIADIFMVAVFWNRIKKENT